MKFSLVLATYNRKVEVELFIKSLLNQEYKLFELIVIDQNINNLIDDIIFKYSNDIFIKHYKSRELGLSYNRNIGLKYITGDIVAFPDDDCEYPPSLLNDIISRFNEFENIDIITGSTIDKNSHISYLKSPLQSVEVTYKNVFSTAISFTIFIKNFHLFKIYFDEKLGVGSKFGSSEETDFLVSFIDRNAKILYLPNIIVFHPVTNFNESINRTYNYALGFGAFHRKNYSKSNYIYTFRFLFYICVNIFRIITLQNLTKNYYSLHGKIKGFINYN